MSELAENPRKESFADIVYGIFDLCKKRVTQDLVAVSGDLVDESFEGKVFPLSITVDKRKPDWYVLECRFPLFLPYAGIVNEEIFCFVNKRGRELSGRMCVDRSDPNNKEDLFWDRVPDEYSEQVAGYAEKLLGVYLYSQQVHDQLPSW